MNEKVDKYFKLLHPEYDTLTPGKQVMMMGDKSFIEEHIDEIDEKYKAAVSQTKKEGKEVDEQKLIEIAVKLQKADKYFKLLYPEYDTLTTEEQMKATEDHIYIIEHIDEIDKMYETAIFHAKREENKVDKQKLIKGLINEIQSKFSIEQIGKATINSSTELKHEAKKVERANQKTKEGEELGDGN